MTTLTATLAFPLAADLGEGPVWDARAQQLLCVDITGRKIHMLDLRSGTMISAATPTMVGCVALRASGGCVAALASGLASVDLASGRVTPLPAPPEHDPASCRFNDGKCDPQGRLWAGTMSLHGASAAGALYCFSEAKQSRQTLTGVSISNGLAWSADSATLYYIDSPTRRVDAFVFDGDTAALGARRTALSLDLPGVPDGCTIDDEGMLWIAHWDGSCVTRWDPRTGAQLARIAVPAPRVTSCTFGDADSGTLYITTARNGLSPAQLAAFPDSGGIFACRPGVSGPPAVAFRG